MSAVPVGGATWARSIAGPAPSVVGAMHDLDRAHHSGGPTVSKASFGGANGMMNVPSGFTGPLGPDITASGSRLGEFARVSTTISPGVKPDPNVTYLLCMKKGRSGLGGHCMMGG